MEGSFATVLWVCLPFVIAAGSGLLAAIIMQARMEVALAQQREGLAEARTLLATAHRTMEDRVKAAEEAARRKALDEFMSDIRIEERHYVRESKSLFLNQRSLVLQERVFFRNIPLTEWVEREYPISLGGLGRSLPETQSGEGRKLLK